MAVNPDSIPRYQTPTWDEYAEMADEEGSICDECRYAIEVDGRVVCVADYVLRQGYFGTDVTEDSIRECDDYGDMP